MTLLIACILIYHFGLPWWMYLVAAAVFAAKFAWLHVADKTEISNMDGRFNVLNRLLQQEFDETRAKIPDRAD